MNKKHDYIPEIEHTLEVQRLFLRMMLTEPELYTRISNIFNSENFDKNIRAAAAFIHEHAREHRSMPMPEQIDAACGQDIQQLDNMDEGHGEWFMQEFERFTKRRELERAILMSADLLEKGDFSPVEKLIKDAVQISITKDMGTDYFTEAKQAITSYYNNGGQVSTGWPSLDRVLYGGFSRGQLNIFAGGSGSGKSLVMMNIALNWLEAGMSGVYISLELSEELCTLRTTAMLSAMCTKDIRRDLDSATLKVTMAGKKSGKYRIKAMPAQSTINDIRAYVKEIQIQTGMPVDFVMVDYLDLLMPVSAKVSPNDLFVKDKYVSEELRNLSAELNILLVTASQLNRSAVEEIEFDHSHISGGISKINTADNVFGIFTSRAMRERGKYQIQAMKTRSSNGVGQKIELEYNVDTMRITDPGEDAQAAPSSPASTVLARIKTGSTVVTAKVDVEPVDQAPVRAQVQSTQLKSLLNSMKPQGF